MLYTTQISFAWANKHSASANKEKLDLFTKYIDVKIDKIKEELADIINYAFLIAYKYNLDIKDIVLTKLKRNAEKYPIDKAKGCAKKYSEL